jgi:hypothetical protein
MTAIHMGISGWRYMPWRGDYYPKGLTHKRELLFASRAGISLWPFARDFIFNTEQIDRCFEPLPRGADPAAALARQHEAQVNDHTSLQACTPMFDAVEICHENFEGVLS